VAKRILILTNSIGRGEDGLGRVLMRNFLYSLARSEADRPVAVMLMNEGVRLAALGSDSIDDLRLLVESGVAVKACGTCLDYLGLTESLVVGEISAMPAAVDALLGADDIVTIA
jgi:selenium metabolism protein YedF